MKTLDLLTVKIDSLESHIDVLYNGYYAAIECKDEAREIRIAAKVDEAEQKLELLKEIRESLEGDLNNE